MNLKKGEIIFAATHAELLNSVLGTHYKAWMKSGTKLRDGKWLWMIELTNSKSSAGFINKLVGTERISEKHLGTEFTFENHNTYVNAMMTGKPYDASDRVVFDVVKSGYSRRYIFRGVFRLNKEECTQTENIWDLIMPEYSF